MHVWLLITALLMSSSLFPSSAATDVKSSHAATAENPEQATEIPEHIMHLIYKSRREDTNKPIVAWLQANPETNKNARAGETSLLYQLLSYSYSFPVENNVISLAPTTQLLLEYKPAVHLGPHNEIQRALRGLSFFGLNDEVDVLYPPKDIIKGVIRLFIGQGYDWPTIKQEILKSRTQLEHDKKGIPNRTVAHLAADIGLELMDSIIQEIDDEIAAAEELGKVLEPHLITPLIGISKDYHTDLLKREKKKAAKSGEKSKAMDTK